MKRQRQDDNDRKTTTGRQRLETKQIENETEQADNGRDKKDRKTKKRREQI